MRHLSTKDKTSPCIVFHLISGQGETDRDTVSDLWSISVMAHMPSRCDNQRQSRLKCS